MTIFAIAHSGAFKDLAVTTHPRAEAARQYLAGLSRAGGEVIIGEEDLNFSGPSLVTLHNWLNPESPVNKFATKKDAQRRVFAALDLKYGKQPHEPFNPVETPTGLTDNPTGAATEDSSEGSNSEEANMAKKTKTAKKTAKKATKKKAATPRVAKPLYEELHGNQPKADMSCGAYIRSLIMAGKSSETILEQVAKHYPDSKAKGSDVSWNRGKLKAAGKKLPDVAK